MLTAWCDPLYGGNCVGEKQTGFDSETGMHLHNNAKNVAEGREKQHAKHMHCVQHAGSTSVANNAGREP